MEKCSTGILGLDHMLDGGIPLGRNVLLCGESGTGKTIFAMHFLMQGAKRGEPVALISLDETPEKMIENISQFGWDLSPYLEKNLFHFIDASQENLAFSDDPNHIQSEWERFFDFIHKHRISRLVIDPFRFEQSQTTNVILNEKLKEIIYYIENNLLCTSLMIIPTKYTIDKPLKESIWSSGFIELAFNTTTQTMDRHIIIRKMRGSKIEHLKKRYFIKENLGFFIPSYHLEHR